MKLLVKDLFIALFLGFLLPGIVLNGFLIWEKRQPFQQEERISQTFPEKTEISMKLQGENGEVEEMDLDTYLVGVVLAEMPAWFEPEALKAQSVAARTYTYKALTTGGKHGNGSVCTASACCQGYIAEQEYLSQGGTREGVEKIRAAVAATSGQVLTYEGELIEATYFSCSGGSTEDAQAVWGTEYPYLQSVYSPGEETSEVFESKMTFTPDAFQQALGVELEGSPDSWFGLTSYTEGGGVSFMTIGSQTYTGTQLRSLLGLRSTAFRIKAGEQITVTTRGYGHRVGMSQYGADAMAVAGSDYTEILYHYYQGTQITQLS